MLLLKQTSGSPTSSRRNGHLGVAGWWKRLPNRDRLPAWKLRNGWTRLKLFFWLTTPNSFPGFRSCPPPNQRVQLAWRGGRTKGTRTTQLMRDSLGRPRRPFTLRGPHEMDPAQRAPYDHSHNCTRHVRRRVHAYGIPSSCSSASGHDTVERPSARRSCG